MNVSRRIRVGIAVAVVATLTALGLVLAFVIDREARTADVARVTAELERANTVVLAELGRMPAAHERAHLASLDAATLKRLRALAGVPFQLSELGAAGAREYVDFDAGPGHIQVETTAGGDLSGAVLLFDANGRPAALLHVQAPPTLRNAAHRTLAYVAAALCLAAGFFLFVVHWLGMKLTTSLDALSESELVRTFVEQTTEGIVLVDRARGVLLRSNDAAKRYFGPKTPEEAAAWLATVLGDLTRPAEQVPLGPREVQVPQSGGVALDLEIAAQPISRGAQNILCVLMRDVSERKRVEHRIRHQAWHDGLTQLPNRALFNDRLGIALAQTRRTPEKIGVLLLDLDHFKTVNDTLGHDQGDALLIQVAERLRRCVRDGDTIARLGGDEFVVLLPRLDAAPQAGTVAERIISAMRASFHLGGREVHVSCSVGVAVHPEDGNDASTLFRNADLAMYHAKQQGRNAWMLHDPSMNEEAADLLELKSELVHALRNEELYLDLQPQVDGVAGQLVGFEALVRWRSPKRGIVPPGRFIPVAEETGLIVALGDWVLRAACKQVRDWLDADLPAVRIAVNFSARQFLERDLVERVRLALEETRCPPHLIEVEVTESIAMKHAERSVAALDAFRAMGLAVALDDFGTGYSSLAYLRQFPLDRLKMDRAFIKDIAERDNSRTMVDSIISLAHSLGLEVCAEGVETPDQLEMLRSLGCDILQGFGLARPMPALEATRLVRAEEPPRWAGFFELALTAEASAARLVREPTSLPMNETPQAHG